MSNRVHPLITPAMIDVRASAEMVGVGRTKFLQLVAVGQAPKPICLGARCYRWRVDELREWIAGGCRVIEDANEK